jgi:hypothetical protein
MSDTENTTSDDTNEPPEERLHYAGATTRHEGTGEQAHPLPAIPASELGADDIQPGVTGHAEPRHRKQR